jgi:Raf kinase inhibitor-like YbhB/YbcL family protein
MAMAGCSKDNVAACAVYPMDNWLTTIGGANHSPELDFGLGPAGTLSFAIALHDESNNYTHWVIWNIPANAQKLPASLPSGSDPAGLTGVKQVSFWMNGDGYAGPGAHSHVYQFKVYALKVASFSPGNLPSQNPQETVRAALEADSDVIATAELLGATSP